MKPLMLLLSVFASGWVSAQSAPVKIVEEGRLPPVVGQSRASLVYPAGLAGTGDDVCIALGYSIRPDGTTSDFQLLRAWSSDRRAAETRDGYLNPYAEAAARVVAQWKFAPGETAGDGVVTTVATMAFEGRGETKRLSDRCRIADLAAFYRNNTVYGQGWGSRKRDRQHVNDVVGAMERGASYARWISDHRQQFSSN